MKRLICALVILILTFTLCQAQSTRQNGTQKNDKESRSIQPAAAGNPVTGSGTTGRLARWTGVDGSNSFNLGNSIIFEDKFGKVGIGTTAPTSPLTVQGMIETTLGGYKFPDGTVQTTAGLASVFHNATLTGNGTAASPLGVAIPLILEGESRGVAVISVVNTAHQSVGIDGAGSDVGVRGQGFTVGDGNNFGIGVAGIGGVSSSVTFKGGIGVLAGGGSALAGGGGDGVEARGGISLIGISGAGVRALGGDSPGETSGHGVVATGGNSSATGNQARGGDGVRATGGDVGTNGKAGDGVVAIGGDYPKGGTPGHGVVATGGRHSGTGVVAKGSDEGDSNFSGGEGVEALGGIGSGALNAGGHGIVAIAGSGVNGASNGFAGFFIGNVRVQGDLNVTGTKNFKIDHPLDPENKYLSHAAIESSEVLNVYSGNVKTNKKGEAIVTLPDWFEALNKDLRYQLTVIGTFAQAIVSDEVRNNHFTIKTNAPNVKVSWQVTGVRSDAVMLKRPFKPEEEKPERERGTYLNPEAYGQPQERGSERARLPEMMRQTKATGEKQIEGAKQKAQSRHR
jgi:hypothetical protein